MENPFIGLRAALFDLDGTLIETHIDFGLMKREMIRLAEQEGVDPEGLSGLDALAIVERARRDIACRAGEERGREFCRRAFSLLEEIEVSHCAHPVEIPGAQELLRELERASIAAGIVTRNCRRVAEKLVRDAGLAHGALLTRDDVPRTKPDPAHLHAAIAALGLDPAPAPASTLPYAMIGDHWMDAQGGRAACMRTVGILRGRPDAFFAPSPPDLLVDELADLVPIAREA